MAFKKILKTNLFIITIIIIGHSAWVNEFIKEYHFISPNEWIIEIGNYDLNKNKISKNGHLLDDYINKNERTLDIKIESLKDSNIVDTLLIPIPEDFFNDLGKFISISNNDFKNFPIDGGFIFSIGKYKEWDGSMAYYINRKIDSSLIKYSDSISLKVEESFCWSLDVTYFNQIPFFTYYDSQIKGLYDTMLNPPEDELETYYYRSKSSIGIMNKKTVIYITGKVSIVDSINRNSNLKIDSVENSFYEEHTESENDRSLLTLQSFPVDSKGNFILAEYPTEYQKLRFKIKDTISGDYFYADTTIYFSLHDSFLVEEYLWDTIDIGEILIREKSVQLIDKVSQNIFPKSFWVITNGKLIINDKSIKKPIIQIYNSLGKLVKEVDQNSINLKNLSKGVYFSTLKNNRSIEKFKFIVR